MQPNMDAPLAPPAAAPRPSFSFLPREPRELLYSLLLALYAAVLGYAWTLRVTDPLPGGPQKFYRIYELSWAYGVAFALASAFALQVLRWLFFPGSKAFYPLLLGALHVVCVLVLRRDMPSEGLHLLALKWSGYAVLGALALLFLGRKRGHSGLALFEAVVLAAAPPLAVWVYAWFNGPPAWDPLLNRQAAGIAVLVASLALWEAGKGGWKRSRLFDLAVFAGVLWALFPWRPSFNLHHQGFFLDPANAVLLGRSLLTEIKCQYGVFHIYLIAACFKVTGLPASYLGFSVFTALAYALEFAALWALVLGGLRSRALALLTLATLIGFNRFGFPGIGDDPLGYPSVGPWRFGMSLLQLMTAWWRLRRPGRSRTPELAFFALASVWSAEVLVYTACGYIAFSALELWAEEKPWQQWAAGLLSRLEQMLLSMALAHAALALMIRFDSGRWPDYTLYFDFIKQYGGDLATYPLDLRTGWFLLVSLPVAGMVASLLLALRGVKARELALIAGLSAMAAAEFSYFLTRSHPSNLRFILLPSVTAGAVAIDLLLAQASLSRLFRWSAAVSVAGLLAITLLQSMGGILAAQPATRWVPELQGRPGWGAFFDLLKHPPDLNTRVTDAVNLARKYYGDSKQGTFLVQGEACPAAHIQAGMIEVSEFTNPDEDGITAPRVKDGVYDPRLKAGDIVIVEGNPALYERLQAERYNSLKARFNFSILECGPANLCAARLDPK